MKTQKQMFEDAQKMSAEVDLLFLDMVADGLTKEELQKNIDRRPGLWKRYENWLPKLPSSKDPK